MITKKLEHIAHSLDGNSPHLADRIRKVSKKIRGTINKKEVMNAAMSIAHKAYGKKVDSSMVGEMVERAIEMAKKKKGDTKLAIALLTSFFKK